MLFAGFFVRIQQIPVYLKWAQYLFPLKYALNLSILTEFQNCGEGSDNPSYARAACERLLAANEIHRDGTHFKKQK
jgi:hypothetical protein